MAEEIIEDVPDEGEPAAKTSRIEVIQPKVKKDESWNRSIGVLTKKNAMTNLVKSKRTDAKDMTSKPIQSSAVVDKPPQVPSFETTKNHQNRGDNKQSSQSIGVLLKTQNDSSLSGVTKPSGLSLLASYSGSDSDSQ